MKEITESKFSSFCKNKGYYRIKLAIDKSLIKTGANFAKSMPADYIVLSDKHLFFVEVKEVLSNSFFPNSRLKQQFRLTKLSNEFNKRIHSCHVLIHFKELKIITLFEINEYNSFINKLGKQSFNIKDVPTKNIYTWRNLELK